MALRSGLLVLALALLPSRCDGSTVSEQARRQSPPPTPAATPSPALDRAAYDAKLRSLAHLAAPASASASASRPVWPVKTVYPEAGALLPFHRVVAYYGNFYSKRMGILGQHSPEEVLRRLRAAARQWAEADPTTPVIPAIDYVVESAQGYAGPDHQYVARMPDDQVDKALEMANEVDGLLFLDFQVGLSTLQAELPRYEKYVRLPNVEVSIDPEFTMPPGRRPGTKIGTVDARDVNWVAGYMAGIVRARQLPPKILVVHRFTRDMVTNYRQITPLPEVQIVMDMDGWGSPEGKIGTYKMVITSEPVQFTGFKLFYQNDRRRPPHVLLTPRQILELVPAPSYIQYQ